MPAAPSAAVSPVTATAPDQVERTPQLIVAPVDPLLQEGDDLTIEVTVDNRSDSPTSAATVEVLLTADPIGTRYSLSRWFAGEAIHASSVITTVSVPAVAAHDRRTVRATVEAEALGLDGRAWGAYGLAASSGELGAATSIVVRDEPGEATPTRLALAAPIDAPVGATGLLDADQLEQATTPGGAARTALDAALGAGATIGVDPAFGASIEALGADAPAGAESWFERADTSDTYALLYGNTDPVAQVRAGAYPIQSLGVPDADGDLLPANTGLLGSSDPVIDVTETAVQQDDLVALAEHGTVVLSTGAIDETIAGATPNAALSVDGVAVVGADDDVQRLIREAATAEPEAAADLRAELVGLLATITRERPSDQRTLAAVLPPATRGDASALLADLGRARFVETAGIETALEAEPREAVLATTDDPERTAGADLVTQALAEEAEVARIASIVDEPEVLLAELRLSLLAALPDAGRAVTEADRRAIAGLGDAMDEVRGAVQLVGGSPIHAVGENIPLPITISNELDVPANVVLTLRPTNALVTVPQSRIEVTVAPTSQQRVQVPIDVVGTGSLRMVVQLHTPDGVPLGQIQQVQISAQPTIEVAVAWALGIAIVLLIGFGIVRSITKRRRGQAHGDIDELAARAPRDEQQEGTA